MILHCVPIIWINSLQVISAQNSDYTGLPQRFHGVDRENVRVSEGTS